MSYATFDVSYAQILVFDAHMELPFNDWTPAHVAQGFSWRPGSVSFRTLDSLGLIHVEVLVGTHSPRDPTAASRSEPERCIVVPFRVPLHEQCEVATVSGSMRVEIPPGEYALTCEHGILPNGEMWMLLQFDRVSAQVQAKVVIADAELNPPEELVMTTMPA